MSVRGHGQSEVVIDMTQHSDLRKTNKGGRQKTGSLQFRSGSWYAVLSVVVAGETIRKWVCLHTDSKPAARRKLTRLLNQPDDADVNEVAKAPETYAELADRVGKRRKVEGIADIESEHGRERLWIIPEIGHLAVASIKGEHIAGVYERARAGGKSLSHLRHLRSIMRSRFDVALEDESIQSSPMSRVRIPKAKTDRRERAVLTDPELALYLAWQHPDKNRRLAVLERQTMSAIARVFGGLRTGDLHTLQWKHFDAPHFTIGIAPRKKTERPQRIEIPEMLRPILLDWWKTTVEAKAEKDEPVSVLVFPALRGDRAGKGEKRHVSHARAMRRDLGRMFGLETWNPAKGRFEATAGREKSPRERELLDETDFTRPVDFHSWRRAFVQAVAGTGLNAQQAQKLSGHADLSAYDRYLRSTSKTLTIPIEALPDLRVSTIAFYDCPPELLRARQDSNLRPPASKADALSS